MASLLPDSLREYVTDGMEPFYLQPRQMEFATSEADIVVFGGSAGGGKTRALIYEPVSRGLHENPGFTGVIFRETYPEITEAGGPWDESCEVYPWLGARGIIGHHEWRFPSGAKIAFRHCDHEETKYKYKGSQFCYLGLDELTSFSESVFWYLTSRNRSTCGITPYIRCTTNPDVGWVKTKLLAPWVDREYPGKRALSCELRWITRNSNGEIEWHEKQPPGFSRTLTFIRSELKDNPALLEKNPEYEATLQTLLPIERERLLYGNWDVRREGLVYPMFEQCIVEPSNVPPAPTVGGVDYGRNHPFAALWGHVDHDGIIWITGCRYVRQTTIAIHSEAIPRGVQWHADPAGADQTASLKSAGHSVRPCVHRPTRGATGERKSPLLGGIDRVTQRMLNGTLKIVRSRDMIPLITELGSYHYDEKKTNDENPVDEDNHACDALRYLVVGHDRGHSLNSITETESDEDRQAREASEAKAEQERRQELDQKAQADIMDERWWGQ